MNLKKIYAPFSVTLFYFILNFLYLNYFSPHEDAYIMFRYVEMFTQGYGITYFPGGEHLEGATDFLWFLQLSLLNKIGIDTAVAAIILNSIGVFMISYSVFSILCKIKYKQQFLLTLPMFFLWILFLPIFAALGGFSVFSYCGYIVLVLHLLNLRTKLTWVPILSIIIALYRPDGVILGVCFTILGFILLSGKQRKSYFISSFVALGVGIVYFIWRYNYFGELLPLPLYVKQATTIIIALKINLGIILHSKITILSIIIILIIFVIQKKSVKKDILLLAMPSIIFIGILSMAHQSQNIAHRFQAPAIYMLYYLFIVMLINILNKNKFYIYILLIGYFITLITGIILLKDGQLQKIESVFNNNYTYIDSFPIQLNNQILEDGDILALTEAGRLAYWSNKKVEIIDLIGLNTKYTAKNIVTQDYLERINPDIVMFFSTLKFKGTENVYWIEDKKEAEMALPINMAPTREAIVTKEARSYLLDHWEEYDIFFVRFVQSAFLHVYAVKKNKNKSDLFYKLLKDAFHDRKSYFELKKQYKNEIIPF